MYDEKNSKVTMSDNLVKPDYYQSDFYQIFSMIEQAQSNAWKNVNVSLINLY